MVARYSILKCYYSAVSFGRASASFPRCLWVLNYMHSRRFASAPFSKSLCLRGLLDPRVLRGCHGCMDGISASKVTIVVIGGMAACPVGTTQGRCCL